MAATLMPQGKQRYTDNNGNSLSGGKLYTYEAGTTTPLATYSDQAGATPNANPVVLNARGEATVFWGSSGYKAVLKDASDVEIWSQDNLYAVADKLDIANLADSTSATKGSALIGSYDPVAPAYLKTVSDIINGLPVSILRGVPKAQHAAMIDGTSTYDAGAEWNALIQEIATQKRGELSVDVAMLRTSVPLLAPSDVKIFGNGWTQTFLKPLDAAVFTAAQGVLMTPGFTEDANLWDYYPSYPAGLTMGVQVRDLCIDANRANVANANGLMIYGGNWNLQNIASINTKGHGIWTEAGVPGSSTSGDDLHDFLNMHESFAENIKLSNNDQHNWYYRGPNDSYINNVQCKSAGWAAFYQDQDSTISVGNLEIGSLHAYSALCGHDADGAMIHLANAIRCGTLYVDSSRKNGVKFYGTSSIVNQIITLFNNQLNAGDFYGVKIESAGVQIGHIRDVNAARTSGTNGGCLWITSTAGSNIVGDVRSSYGSGSSIPSTGIKIEAPDVAIGDSIITGYNVAGSFGAVLSASNVAINGEMKSCHTGLQYNNTGTGRNRLKLGFLSNTTDYTTTTTLTGSDMVDFTSDQFNFTLRTSGTQRARRMQLPRLDIGYAANRSVNGSQSTYQKVGTLTGNIVMEAPSTPEDGAELEFHFQQDSSGARTITWNAAYKTNYSNTGNTAFTRYVIKFRYDAAVSLWIQVGAGSGWF